MRATAALSFVVLACLSGCAGGAEEGGPEDGGPAAGDGSSNRPPMGVLHAATGAGPGEIMFHIGGSDPDGDEVAWSLAFGDAMPSLSGSSVPATVNHTYAPGNFTATLTLNDGKASSKLTSEIRIAAQPAVQTIDGTYTAGSEGCAAAGYDQAKADPGAAAGGTTNGTTRIQFAVHPLSIGLPYSAAFTFDQGYIYVSVDFYGSGGALLSSDNTGQSPNFGDATIEGTVPDGAVTAVLFACGGPTTAKVHYEAKAIPTQG